MKQSSKAKYRWKLCLLILLNLLLLTFIFTRSLKSVDESREESGRFLALLKPVLSLLIGEENVTEHLVRKLAHFCEFGALGLSTAGLAVSIPVSPLCAFLSTLLSALTDETLQLFSARGSQVQDVWLDYSGAVCGILFLLLLRRLIKNIHGKRS